MIIFVKMVHGILLCNIVAKEIFKNMLNNLVEWIKKWPMDSYENY
jgi:hypothetical protein